MAARMAKTVPSARLARRPRVFSLNALLPPHIRSFQGMSRDAAPPMRDRDGCFPFSPQRSMEPPSITPKDTPPCQAPDAARRRLLNPGIEGVVARRGEAAEMPPRQYRRQQCRLILAHDRAPALPRLFEPALGLLRQAAHDLAQFRRGAMLVELTGPQAHLFHERG